MASRLSIWQRNFCSAFYHFMYGSRVGLLCCCCYCYIVFLKSTETPVPIIGLHQSASLDTRDKKDQPAGWTSLTSVKIVSPGPTPVHRHRKHKPMSMSCATPSTSGCGSEAWCAHCGCPDREREWGRIALSSKAQLPPGLRHQSVNSL